MCVCVCVCVLPESYLTWISPLFAVFLVVCDPKVAKQGGVQERSQLLHAFTKKIYDTHTHSLKATLAQPIQLFYGTKIFNFILSQLRFYQWSWRFDTLVQKILKPEYKFLHRGNYSLLLRCSNSPSQKQFTHPLYLGYQITNRHLLHLQVRTCICIFTSTAVL